VTRAYLSESPSLTTDCPHQAMIPYLHHENPRQLCARGKCDDLTTELRLVSGTVATDVDEQLSVATLLLSLEHDI